VLIWNRRNKVPALILNATTLNTGNAWQFTATYMGEPRMGDALTDGNDRLRRFYYNRNDTPQEYKRVRLGCAVAASACVPGLFEPVSFPDLYEKKPKNENKAEKITVRLVDGGVYDNQGVESLLEQNCTRILMSDASGQLDVKDEPGAGRIGTLFRATSILQNRVRNTLYRNYDARGRASLLQVLMSVHLKKGLTAKPIPWRGCNDIPDVDWEPPRPKNFQLPYGILETVQQSLSRIRTDLDSFSDKEAYALMASGYYMAKKEIANSLGQEFSDSKKPHDWPFLDPQMTMEFQSSARQMTQEPQPSAFIQLLNVGQYRLFKAWRISKLLRVLSYGVLLATVTAIGWMGYTHMEKKVFINRLDLVGMSFDLTLTCGGVALLLLAAILYLVLEMKGFRLTGRVSHWAASLGIGLVGWLPATIHLLVFDRLFLNQGRLDPQQQSRNGSIASDPATSKLTMIP
jgi:predicted acylesterase/phospholipase RssA